MSDLKNETISVLKHDGYTVADIEFISLYDTEIPISEFFEFAAGFWYNSGYGHEYVPPFVLMMADGNWYTRGEYDGSEWWELHKSPNMPTERDTIDRVMRENDIVWCYSLAYRKAHGYEREAAEKAEEDYLTYIDELDRMYA